MKNNKDSPPRISKLGGTLLTILMVIAFLVPHPTQAAWYHNSGTENLASLWCSVKAFFGGGCDTDVVEDTLPEPSVPAAEKESTNLRDPDTVPDDGRTRTDTVVNTAPPNTVTYVTNEYITNPTTIIRETVAQSGGRSFASAAPTTSFVPRTLFDIQTTATHNSITDAASGITDSIAEGITTARLTVSGNTTLSGTLTGATTTLSKLTVSNGTTLNSSLTLAALSGGFLTTDQNGLVSTTTIGAASVTADSLDFAQFTDAMTVDSTTTFDLDTNAADLNFDSGTFFIDSSTNRVGVGTTSPSAKLDVWGNLNVGTSSTPTLFADTATGNVGIGTASPNNLLHIYSGSTGTFEIEGNTDNAQLILNSGTDGSGTEGDYIFFQSNSNDEWYLGKDTEDDFAIFDYARGSIVFEIKDNGHMLLMQDGGNVGIGETAPGSKLSVSGGGSFGSGYDTTAAPTNGLIIEGNVGIGTTGPGADLHVRDTSEDGSPTDTPGSWLSAIFERTWSVSSGAGIAIQGSSKATDGAGIIALGNADDWDNVILRGGNDSFNINFGSTASGQGKVTVLNTGNVGIGETAPGSKLSVSGGGSFGASYDTTAAPTNGLIVEGNVGVGTVSPGQALDVVGNINVNSGISVGLTSNAALQFTSLNVFNYLFSGAQRVQVGSSFVTVNSSGSYRWSSDANANTADTYLKRTDTSTITLSSDGSSGTANLNVLGNVGIGTTSPSAKLTIAGGDSGDLLLTNGADLQFTDSLGVAQNILTLHSDNNLYLDGRFNNGTGDIVIRTNQNSERMRITNSGNVGIGTTSPGALLDMYKSSPSAQEVLFRIGTSDDGSRFSVDEDGDIASDGALFIDANSGATNSRIGGRLTVGGTGATETLEQMQQTRPQLYFLIKMEVTTGR